MRQGVGAGFCCFAIIAGVLLLGAGQADARAFATGTSFGFYKGTPGTPYPSSFHGQVHSDVNQCRRGRLVRLLRRQGRRNVLVRRTRASSTGQWTIEMNRVPTARYFVHVPRKRFGPRGRHICRPTRSSVLRFGDS